MGPLYRDTITRHKKNLAGWQKIWRGKKKKEITLFIKLISFLVKVPCRLPSFKVLLFSFLFFCIMCPYRAPAPLFCPVIVNVF